MRMFLESYEILSNRTMGKQSTSENHFLKTALQCYVSKMLR